MEPTDNGTVLPFPGGPDVENEEALAAEGEAFKPTATFITPEPVIILDLSSLVLTLEAAKDLAISLSAALNEAKDG